MSRTQFSLDKDKNQQLIKNLVLILTMTVFIFSAYMNASFLGNIGTTIHAAIIFSAIGVFVELSKICAGMVVIGKFVVTNKFKRISILILCIFSTVSFLASTATISSNLDIGKKNTMQADENYQAIQLAIKRQKDIVDNLLISQKLDIENGYRARASKLLQIIKEEQQTLSSLQDQEAMFVNAARSVASGLNSIHNLISLDSSKFESVLIVILGALTEISGIFLLFLNFSFHKEDKNIHLNGVGNNSSKEPSSGAVSGNLPISLNEYKNLTEKIVTKKVKPTQRGVKAVVSVGNEKIAEIFKFLVKDGVLERTGRNYSLCT